MHPTGGSLRVFRQFVWLGAGSGKMALSRPAHQRVTQAVGRSSIEWKLIMKFSKAILIAAAIIFVLSSCSLGKKTEQETQSEIYSRAMAYGFSYSGSENHDYCKGKSLIISSLTEDFRTVTTNWETAKAYFPQLEQETWESFLQVNAQQIPFPSDLDLGCKYTLVERKPSLPEPPTENCPIVHFLSQIGFNSRKDQALVSHVELCGWDSCGSLYLAELTDGHWIVKNLDVIVCA